MEDADGKEEETVPTYSELELAGLTLHQIITSHFPALLKYSLSLSFSLSLSLSFSSSLSLSPSLPPSLPPSLSLFYLNIGYCSSQFQ